MKNNLKSGCNYKKISRKEGKEILKFFKEWEEKIQQIARRLKIMNYE